MKFYMTDIVFIIMTLYFGKEIMCKEPIYGIEIDTPSCREVYFNKYKPKPLENFDLYTFELNKKNERTQIPKIKRLISELKNKTSKKEGIIIHFSNSSYQSYISTLTTLTENKIDECFFLDDAICYIPIKKYYPKMLVYNNVNKFHPPIKRIAY